jgi:uncharacterized OB-fold protein
VTTIPLPEVSPLTAPFWAACREGVLTVQECRRCGHRTFPPEVFCARCLSPDLVWRPSSGEGVLRSYSVVWRAAQPAFAVPYLAAIVALSDGWCMFTNLVDCPVERAAIGMPVAVRFVTRSPEITLPYFAPADSDRPTDQTRKD